MSPPMSSPHLFYRHPLWIRVTHWLNAICMAVLLMSGLQIFNAHPALYWGQKSDFDHPILSINAVEDAQGNESGVTTIAGHSFNTTGVLGLSRAGDRAFPDWATLPHEQWLAIGRRWHFFFAWIFVINGAIYVATSLIGRHLRGDLVPTRADLAHTGRSIWEHVRLQFPKGDEAKRYNVLQKLAYLSVAFVLGPIMVLAGLTMSPRIDASYPILLDIFGGRQSARTIHFILAFSFLGFFVIHIVMVLLSGVFNNLRSMITGSPAGTIWEQVVSALKEIGRRGFLLRAAGGLAALSLGGCDDSLSQNPKFIDILESAENLTRVTQKAITGAQALAPEYSEADISTDFRANGTTDPGDDKYKALAKNNFADYRLKIGGLVEAPAQFSLAVFARAPVTNADHPARLRRGLELHRKMEGRAALNLARQGAPEIERALCHVLFGRPDG